MVYIDKALREANIAVDSSIVADHTALKAAEKCLEEACSDPNWMSKRLGVSLMHRLLISFYPPYLVSLCHPH